MVADKITKEELKGPDKFQVLFARVVGFVDKHTKEVGIAAAVVVFVVLAAGGWHFYQQHQEKEAMAAYNKATEEYFVGRAAGKDAATLVKGFSDVAKKYAGTDGSAFALYRMGNFQYEQGNFDASIKAYQDYLKDSSANDEFGVLVYNGLGYSFEAKKDYKGAVGYYEKALNAKAGAAFESMTCQNMGRAYEALKDKRKALEYYKRAAEKTVQPGMKELLNRKISTLG